MAENMTETEEKEHNTSSNPLVIGAGSGLILGAIAGPIGALVGSIAGAGIGYWYDGNHFFDFSVKSPSVHINTRHRKRKKGLRKGQKRP